MSTDYDVSVEIRSAAMNPAQTALILIGYQNDYFAPDGILQGVLESPQRTSEVLGRTIQLIEALQNQPITMIATPIIFSSDYSEVTQAGGILAAIKEAKAFQAGQPGAATVDALADFGDRIIEIPGKRGLNAFVQTALAGTLESKQIQSVVVAGAVTSICIDSTARAAYERGMNVSILSDCTAARTVAEQEFFCESIFPTYATVMTSEELLAQCTAPQV
ncbi:MAG: cysteine hydrolase [Phycisphaerales bacterium]|nr:cysteine hydrolase [Phycisphaerales bacterium]